MSNPIRRFGVVSNVIRTAEVGAPGRAETMLQYVIRRAGEFKRYKRVERDTGVGYSWLTKLARGRIPNPNYEDIETLFFYYKALELGCEWMPPAAIAERPAAAPA